MERQPGVSQRGLAALIRQRDDNSGRTMLTKQERRFVNGVLHNASLAHRPDIDERLNDLAQRTGLDPPLRHEDQASEASPASENRGGLSSAFMAIGALAALGVASYSAYQELKRTESEKKESRKGGQTKPR